ncbi:unnamed protein product [Chrysoparadoxa australica]
MGDSSLRLDFLSSQGGKIDGFSDMTALMNVAETLRKAEEIANRRREEKLEEIRNLTPEQKEERRKRKEAEAKAYAKLTPEERQQKKKEDFAKLSPEEQEAKLIRQRMREDAAEQERREHETMDTLPLSPPNGLSPRKRMNFDSYRDKAAGVQDVDEILRKAEETANRRRDRKLEEIRNLTPEQKEERRKRKEAEAEAYAKLTPEEKRQKKKEDFAKLSPEEQEAKLIRQRMREDAAEQERREQEARNAPPLSPPNGLRSKTYPVEPTTSDADEVLRKAEEIAKRRRDKKLEEIKNMSPEELEERKKRKEAEAEAYAKLTPEERRQRKREEFAKLSPEEQEAKLIRQRMREEAAKEKSKEQQPEEPEPEVPLVCPRVVYKQKKAEEKAAAKAEKADAKGKEDKPKRRSSFRSQFGQIGRAFSSHSGMEPSDGVNLAASQGSSSVPRSSLASLFKSSGGATIGTGSPRAKQKVLSFFRKSSADTDRRTSDASASQRGSINMGAGTAQDRRQSDTSESSDNMGIPKGMAAPLPPSFSAPAPPTGEAPSPPSGEINHCLLPYADIK